MLEATPEWVPTEITVRPELCTSDGILHGGEYLAPAETLGTPGTALNLQADLWTITAFSTKFIASANVYSVITGVHR